MFKEYNQNQNFLIPPSYEEFLWESHEAKILNDIINELNLDCLYLSYKNKNKWTSAYNPNMLLKILFYWYMNETFSSRKIAKKLRSDLAFMYLAWNNTPDFRTINNFRKNKWKELENIFIEIVKLAQEMWLISFWTFSLDWTKIYANASKNKNYSISELEKRIWWLFDLADEEDEREDKLYWKDNEDNIPKDLKDSKKRKEVLKKAKEKLEKAKKKLENKNEELKKAKYSKCWNKPSLRKSINITDIDSRLMEMKRKDKANWYNCQLITENEIIIWNHINDNPADTKTLIPSLEYIKNKYNKIPKVLLADKWYPSIENFEYLENNNIEWYIPVSKNSSQLEWLKYNKKEDIYTDLEWNIYKFKQYNLRKNIEDRKKGRPKKWEIQRQEDYYVKLYVTKLKTWKNKFVQVNKSWLKYQNEQRKKLETKEWKKKYIERKWVERVFGNIKYNLWFERFVLRWLYKVKIEWNLINMVHNLKKVMKFRLS